jgi:molybdate transport system ATP-binding protein
MSTVAHSQGESLLGVSDVVCRLSSRRTLRVAQFSLRQGEHWCLFGGNGAGKSVLARLLCGQLPLGGDHVHYGQGFDPRRDVLFVSFEEQQTLAAMDSRHDISEYSEAALDQGTTVRALVSGTLPLTADAAQRLQALLEALDLLPLQERGIRYLSSGQTRKALLARALFQRPRLLVLDEPLESIDLDSRARLLQVLTRSLHPDTSTLLLCRRERDILPGITHMAVLDQLRIVAQGPLDAVRRSVDFERVVRKPVVIPQDLPPPLPQRRAPAPAQDVALLDLKNVSAGYNGRLVLENLNWSVHAGQHTLISGPNGCGKSTLLSLVNGENHKAYGQDVWVFGRRRGTGETVWDIKSRFGVVSNELHTRYCKGWRVLDVVVSGFFDSLGLYDDSGASEHNAARAWLRTFAIDALAAEYYHELSFGEQRLVLLARAMVKHPAILILDEPCVGLDDHARALILGIVDRIAATTQTQILFVSHTQGEAPQCINQWLHFGPQGVEISPHK